MNPLQRWLYPTRDELQRLAERHAKEVQDKERKRRERRAAGKKWWQL